MPGTDNNVLGTTIEYKFNIENAAFSLFADEVYPRDKYVKLYSHSFNVIIFVKYGAAKVAVEDEEFQLTTGDTIVVSADVKHGIVFENPDTEAVCISFLFSLNSLNKGNNLYEKLNKMLPAGSRYIKENQYLAESILKCFMSVRDGNKYVVSASFYEVLLGLMTECGVLKCETVMHEMLPDGDIARLHKINTLANVYYDRNISVEEIAKLLFLSTRQVNRIIQSCFGCAWKELVIQKRMTVASDLLKNTDMTIEEISEYVGYASVRGFYTAFKKYYNMSPGECRG